MITYGDVITETGTRIGNRAIQGVIRKNGMIYGYTRLITRSGLVKVQFVTTTGDWKIVEPDTDKRSKGNK